MKLYRMTIEWDEYLGADEYRTHVYYKYVAGNRALGKETYNTCHFNEETITDVVKLGFTLKALWICLRGVTSEQYNQTSWQKKA